MYTYMHIRAYLIQYITYVCIDNTPVSLFRCNVQPIVSTKSPRQSQEANHVICICICIFIYVCFK